MPKLFEGPAESGVRYKPDSLRVIILGLVVFTIYGGAIAMAVYSGYLTMGAMYSTGSIPVLPWLFAFFLVISGCLSLIYSFFLRPREARVAADEMAIFWWNGKFKSMRREEMESITITNRSVVLKGKGRTVKVNAIFADWDDLRRRLSEWKPAGGR